MEYRACVTKSRNTNRIFHPKTPKNGVLQWIIVLVLLKVDLTPTQTVYLILKRLKKKCFALDYHACVTIKST